jgi:hypothetical protein
MLLSKDGSDRVIPAVSRDLGFFALVEGWSPIMSPLTTDKGMLWTYMYLKVPIQSPLKTRNGILRTYSNLDPNEFNGERNERQANTGPAKEE